ncbi:hypothetical protein HDU86_000331 [Geranomyces michiganensis]|nr:hypothetical protein HDU86_000331 [Geranomyces michiganensis]
MSRSESIDLTHESYQQDKTRQAAVQKANRNVHPPPMTAAQSLPAHAKRKPLDAQPVSASKKAKQPPHGPRATRQPPPIPADSYAAPVVPSQSRPWAPTYNDDTSSSEDQVSDRDCGDSGPTVPLPASPDVNGMEERVISTVDEVRELLKKRDVRYILSQNGKIFFVESFDSSGLPAVRNMLEFDHMSLKDMLQILDAIQSYPNRALDRALTCSVPGRVIALYITDLLADTAPNVKWSLILPWIDEECRTQRRCSLPLPEPKPYIQAWLQTPAATTLTADGADIGNKPTLLLRATDSEKDGAPASSPTVSAMDILAIFEPPNPLWDKPNHGTAERRELRIAILRKAVDLIAAGKAGLVKQAIDWLERLFGIRDGETTFGEEVRSQQMRSLQPWN